MVLLLLYRIEVGYPLTHGLESPAEKIQTQEQKLLIG